MQWANESPTAQSTASYYGANRGPMLTYRWYWRRPSRPFAAPECHGHKCTHIRRDSWRCPSCHSRISPERLHHRILTVLGAAPFGSRDQAWKRLFKVNTTASPWRKRRPLFNGWTPLTAGARLAERIWRAG